MKIAKLELLPGSSVTHPCKCNSGTGPGWISCGLVDQLIVGTVHNPYYDYVRLELKAWLHFSSPWVTQL